MKTPIITKKKIAVDITDEVMNFMLKVITVLGTLIGFWAVSCLMAGLISVGPLKMMRGYITAVTGY